MNKLISKALIKFLKTKQLAKEFNKVVEEGIAPRLGNPKTIYRTTTPKEVAVLSNGEFVIKANEGNHQAYGWRVGAPFYKPNSYVEYKMLSKRNGVNVDNPVYLTTPVKEDLAVRVGSGGKYGELTPSTEVIPGKLTDYQRTGSLYFPEESSVAFLPGDKLPQDINAWQKINGKWQLIEILPPKRIIISSN